MGIVFSAVKNVVVKSAPVVVNTGKVVAKNAKSVLMSNNMQVVLLVASAVVRVFDAVNLFTASRSLVTKNGNHVSVNGSKKIVVPAPRIVGRRGVRRSV